MSEVAFGEINMASVYGIRDMKYGIRDIGYRI